MPTTSAPLHSANFAIRVFALTVEPEILPSFSSLKPKSSKALPTSIAILNNGNSRACHIFAIELEWHDAVEKSLNIGHC